MHAHASNGMHASMHACVCALECIHICVSFLHFVHYSAGSIHVHAHCKIDREDASGLREVTCVLPITRDVNLQISNLGTVMLHDSPSHQIASSEQACHALSKCMFARIQQSSDAALTKPRLGLGSPPHDAGNDGVRYTQSGLMARGMIWSGLGVETRIRGRLFGCFATSLGFDITNASQASLTHKSAYYTYYPLKLSCPR